MNRANPVFSITQELTKAPLDAILVDDLMVAEGFSYIVRRDGKSFYLMNANDFEKILAMVPMEHAETLAQVWMGIPVYRDRDAIWQVLSGIWYTSLMFKQPRLTR
jgi:hypothetical protein